MKTKACKKLIVTALCCLFLWPGAFVKAARPAAPPVSPFAATGLLVRPDESAEEILLRAHQLDAQAIILTIVGYLRGLGGFPKDRGLALAWGGWLPYLDSFNSMHLLALMALEGDDIPDRDIGARLANCTFATGDDLAAFLKEKGLFDVKPFCDNLEKRKSSCPDWEKEYNGLRERGQSVEKNLRTAKTAVRAFRDKPCSPSLLEDLMAARESAPSDVLAFYAATTHDPAKDAPDWSADRLLLFLDRLDSCARYGSEEKKSAPKYEDPSTKIAMLADSAKKAATNLLCLDREKVLSVIRNAHSGVRIAAANGGPGNSDARLAAVRAMAIHYRDGSPGFVQSSMLASMWMRYAAQENDGKSMLLLAIDLFMEKKYAGAWAWADIAGKSDSSGEETKRLAGRLMDMIEVQAGKDIEKQGAFLRTEYLKAVKERLEWRLKQPGEAPGVNP